MLKDFEPNSKIITEWMFLPMVVMIIMMINTLAMIGKHEHMERGKPQLKHAVVKEKNLTANKVDYQD